MLPRSGSNGGTERNGRHVVLQELHRLQRESTPAARDTGVPGEDAGIPGEVADERRAARLMRLKGAVCNDESGLATADVERIPGYIAAVVEAAERMGLLKGKGR